MDWTRWTPRELACLCFIVDEPGGRVLLIRKKRGFGAGKVNAPGGKLEAGETPLAAAVRETEEEVGVTPLDPAEAGTLRFQFADGYSLHCTVFRATRWEGEPRETPEAAPFWAPLAEVPYGQMWEDDEYWLPHLLKGVRFAGAFTFDGDRMLSREVLVEPVSCIGGAAGV